MSLRSKILAAPRSAHWRAAGFTLVDLVVVVVLLGILSAIAVTRFIDLGSTARVASLNTLASAVRSAAEQTYALCMVSAPTSGCNVTAGTWNGTINGRAYQLSVGWLDAGDNLNGNEIDSAVDYSGFTAELTDWAHTKFILTGAPDPEHCSVSYGQASSFGPYVYQIQIATTGC